MEQININDTCCICLKKYGFLERLDEQDHDTITLYEKLQICTPTQIWHKEYKVCKNCTEHLDTAYQFAIECIKNEKYRQKMFDNYKTPRQCTDCNKSYSSEKYLKQHMVKIHKYQSEDELFVKSENTIVISKQIESVKDEASDISDENDDTTCNNYNVVSSDSEDSKPLINLVPTTFPKTKKRVKMLKHTKIKCEQCSLCFKSYKSLKIHNSKSHRDVVALENSSEYKLICDINDTSSKNSEERIKEEIETYCTKLDDEECKLEGAVINNGIASEDSVDKKLQEHNIDNKENNVIDVKVPDNKSTTSDVTLKKLKKVRKKRMIINGPIKCEECGVAFKRKQILINHIRFKHMGERPYKCETCGLTFRCHTSFLGHKRIHSGELPYICSACGKGFRRMRLLEVHYETHSDIRAYKCDRCEKSFKTDSNLRMHKQIVHTNPEDYKYPCPICGKKSPTKSNRDQHVKRNHSGTKNFTCHICNKKFLFNHEMNTHIRCTHRNDRTYRCDICDKVYKDITYLKKHHRAAHTENGMNGSGAPEKKHLCPFCPKVFSFNCRLQRHMLTHTGEKPFQCAMCSKGFKENYELKGHMRNEHQVMENGEEV